MTFVNVVDVIAHVADDLELTRSEAEILLQDLLDPHPSDANPLLPEDSQYDDPPIDMQ